MNPDELAARQAMMSRLIGQPQPAISQVGPAAGVQAPPMNPMPPPQSGLPQDNIGSQTRKATPTEKMVKSLLPATSTAYNPEVNGLSKVLLTRLIQSL